MSAVHKWSRLVWLVWLATVSAAAAGPLRFAFVSDTHIGSETAAEDLRATVRDINSLAGLSFVVVSGDVTEYGARRQLEQARAILGELRIPCHVLPGNHDCKWSESGATDFARFWKRDRFGFEAGGYRFIGLHQGPVMKMGDGHWAPQDVRWLDTTLRAARRPETPVIFITHYPLDDNIDNWYVVLDLLKSHDTQAVLCGHGHSNRALLFEGIPGIMGRSNLRARKTASGYNLVEIDAGVMSFTERTPGQPPPAPWHSVLLRSHHAAADTRSCPRPDFSVNARYPAVRERWTYHTGWTIAGSPAVVAPENRGPATNTGLAIVGDASGTIYALTLESGRLGWKYKTASAVYATPAASEGLVVVPSTDGCIYGLDAREGRKIWRRQTARPIVASPAIADGRVYLGSSEGKFRALDLRTGRAIWEYAGVAGFIETKPLLYEGKVIFGAWDQHLYALDAQTGRLAWKWKGERSGTLFSPAACWPVGAGGKVFIVAPDRCLTAVEARSGQAVWRTDDYTVRESIGLSEDRCRVYVRSMRDYFYAFAALPAEPQPVWERNADFGYDINSAMLVEKDGVLFYGTKNGRLLALEARTGTLEWEHKLGVGIVNTLVPLSSTRVLATDFDGTIALIVNE